VHIPGGPVVSLRSSNPREQSREKGEDPRCEIGGLARVCQRFC